MIYVIAEIGFSHGGSLPLAVKMIESAAKAGASAVKFQSFFAGDLYMPSHELYQIFKAGELSEADHAVLKKTAESCGVDFLSTPFSPYWVDVLEKLNPAGFKIASMDINNPVLLKSVAEKKRKVYISTGASDLREAGQAVSLLKENGAKDVCVFHCVSNYPTEPKDAMLHMIPKIRAELGVQAGFSDHTLGISVPVAAAALGAEVIEKHFTIDKSLPGPDHKISADPKELAALVSALADVTAAINAEPSTSPRADAEKKSMMRRGIYAGKDIEQGEIITINSLNLVRPEITPLEKLDSFLNRPASKFYRSGEPL